MSDLDTGKTFQHLVVAAIASALVVFVLKSGVDKLFSKPQPAAGSPRSSGHSPNMGTAN